MSNYDTVFNEISERQIIEISQEQRELLLKHLHLLIDKNKELNLTRIDTVESGLVLHVEDSLVAMNEIKQYGKERFCDLGTGGGFPGIPIGIMCGYKGTLVDSVQKKIRAIQEFVDELELDEILTTKAIRAEELALEQPKSYGLVVARALSSLPSILELASPLLKKGGKLVAYKGAPEEEEMLRANKVADMIGMKFVNKRTTCIGEDRITRSIITYEKVGNPKVKLPRRNGLAQKSPLA